VTERACVAGALPAELHAHRFRHPVDQYASWRNFSSNDEQLFSWNIWNSFLGQHETIAHTLGFGESSWNVFLQQALNFRHLPRLARHPVQAMILLHPLLPQPRVAKPLASETRAPDWVEFLVQ
jgi:hypothetical protein